MVYAIIDFIDRIWGGGFKGFKVADVVHLRPKIVMLHDLKVACNFGRQMIDYKSDHNASNVFQFGSLIWLMTFAGVQGLLLD